MIQIFLGRSLISLLQILACVFAFQELVRAKEEGKHQCAIRRAGQVPVAARAPDKITGDHLTLVVDDTAL
ncbi:hypothetical protein D3C76_1741960 [compost metagenome]